MQVVERSECQNVRARITFNNTDRYEYYVDELVDIALIRTRTN